MVRKAERVNQGDLLAKEPEFMDGCPEEPGWAGVRAPIGAMKSRNGDGAKGCRKVDTCSAERWRQYQCECPNGLSKLASPRLTRRSAPNGC